MNNESAFIPEHASGAGGWLANLPALLRSLGAAAILFSLYSFLVRGWSGGDDLVRYAVLLGHTVLLAVIALASVRWLGESKGPRLLLTLALASVTANVAVLGAFLYAAVVSASPDSYPSFLLWSGVNVPGALALIAGSLLLMAPVVLIGFRSLVRARAKPLSGLFLLSNAVLLIPLRDTHLSVLLASVSAVFVLWLSASISRRRIEVKTREGVIAIVLQFLPPAILLGRTCWLYDADALVVISAAILLFAGARQCTLLMERGNPLRWMLEVGSVWAALVAGAGVYFFFNSVAAPLAVMTGGLLAATMVLELSRRAVGFAEGYRVVAGIVAATGTLLSLWMGSGAEAIAAIAIGVGLIVLSHRWRAKSLFVAGSLGALGGLLSLVADLLHWFHFGNWIGLALIGMVAIVMASVLESHSDTMWQKLRVHTGNYRSWKIWRRGGPGSRCERDPGPGQCTKRRSRSVLSGNEITFWHWPVAYCSVSPLPPEQSAGAGAGGRRRGIFPPPPRWRPLPSQSAGPATAPAGESAGSPPCVHPAVSGELRR